MKAKFAKFMTTTMKPIKKDINLIIMIEVLFQGHLFDKHSFSLKVSRGCYSFLSQL